MTPYYSDGPRHIYHADALQVMRKMPNDSVDVVITSPPYNMGLVPGGNGRGMYKPGPNAKAGRFRDGYGEHGDAMDQADYDAWQRECLIQMWRVARLAVYYNHRPRVEHGVLRWPLGLDFGIPLRQVIIWDRGTGIDVNLRAYCTRQEHIYLFAKAGFKLVDTAASGQGDVWRLGMDYEEKEHPAPFPVSLPAKIIATTGAESVLDPFMGSGTTLRAAKDVGIAAIGIEIEERWCRRAIERLAQESLWPAA
jgi:site-specific DNA-methyltransferase (adenine-specific)